MKRTTKIKEAGLTDNQELVNSAEEADRLQELATIAKRPEGKALVKTLIQDYILKARHLQGMYKTASRDEMVSYIASMEASWDTATLLVNAKGLLEFLDEEINNALTEQLGVSCVGVPKSASPLPLCQHKTYPAIVWYNLITLVEYNHQTNWLTNRFNMTNQVDTTENEVIDSPETTENTEQKVEEPTVADLHEEGTKEPKETKEVSSVPFKKFIKEKERRKEVERELAELRSQYEGDDDVDDVDEEPEVKKLAQKLEQIEAREIGAKKEAIFTENLNKALENSPEYKDIVNMGVLRALAFDPANSNKTYKQLLEEAYGNAVTGRRTIETTTPRGGAKDTVVDMKRAQTDSAYRHEVLADPDTRKQYNEGLTDRVFRQEATGLIN